MVRKKSNYLDVNKYTSSAFRGIPIKVGSNYNLSQYEEIKANIEKRAQSNKSALLFKSHQVLNCPLELEDKLKMHNVSESHSFKM